MKAQTKGAISLGPSGNLQDGYRFMALDAGEKITRRDWDAIPTPELVIACVNMLGKDQPKLFTFADRHGRLIADAEAQDAADDIDNAMDNNDDVDFAGVDPAISNHVEIPGVDDEEGQEHPTPQEIEIIDDLNIASDPPPGEAETVLQDAAAEPMPQRKEGMSLSQTSPMRLHRRVLKMRRTWPSSRFKASLLTCLSTLPQTCTKRASQRTGKVWPSC
jgi:hypothetical protein